MAAIGPTTFALLLWGSILGVAVIFGYECYVNDYCDRADVAVLNAFKSAELGDGAVSHVERESLASLQRLATRTVSLAE